MTGKLQASRVPLYVDLYLYMQFQLLHCQSYCRALGHQMADFSRWLVRQLQ